MRWKGERQSDQVGDCADRATAAREAALARGPQAPRSGARSEAKPSEVNQAYSGEDAFMKRSCMRMLAMPRPPASLASASNHRYSVFGL